MADRKQELIDKIKQMGEEHSPVAPTVPVLLELVEEIFAKPNTASSASAKKGRHGKK